MAAVRLWWVDLTTVRLDRSALAGLDPVQTARAESFTRPELRRRYQGGQVALRAILAEQLAVPPSKLGFGRDRCPCGRPEGRPTVATPATRVQFSLARSADLAVIAVHDGPVGVDVEAEVPGRALAPLADALHPADRSALDQAAHDRTALDQVPTDQDLLRWWVRTEAVLKCRGEGIRHGVGRFPVLGGPLAADCIWLPVSAPSGYAAALAIAGTRPATVTVLHWG